MYKFDSGFNELKIDAWFPTLIGVSFYKDHKKDASSIIKNLETVKSKCPKSTGESSFFLHSCHKDKKLKNLNLWIQNRVNEYTNFYGFPKKVKPVESWFHWYKENNHNDTHVHLGRTISVIYYLQSDPEDSRVVFHSPVPVDMKNPFNITANDNKEYLQKDHSFTECFYKPVEGMLLIFRSYLLHKVELKNNKLKDRIIISWDLD
jgi:uncharacterized protein (TIGR02466 family)